jgi:hypothetical protein
MLVKHDAEPDLDELLRQLVGHSWMLYAFGDRHQPTAIASVGRAPHWADVIVLRGHDHAAAYRTLVHPHDDPLAADWVVWHYLADPARTIRAALTIPLDVLGERPYPIPAECRLPEAQQRPMTIRTGGRIAT